MPPLPHPAVPPDPSDPSDPSEPSDPAVPAGEGPADPAGAGRATAWVAAAGVATATVALTATAATGLALLAGSPSEAGVRGVAVAAGSLTGLGLGGAVRLEVPTRGVEVGLTGPATGLTLVALAVVVGGTARWLHGRPARTGTHGAALAFAGQVGLLTGLLGLVAAVSRGRFTELGPVGEDVLRVSGAPLRTALTAAGLAVVAAAAVAAAARPGLWPTLTRRRLPPLPVGVRATVAGALAVVVLAQVPALAYALTAAARSEGVRRDAVAAVLAMAPTSGLLGLGAAWGLPLSDGDRALATLDRVASQGEAVPSTARSSGPFPRAGHPHPAARPPSRPPSSTSSRTTGGGTSRRPTSPTGRRSGGCCCPSGWSRWPSSPVSGQRPGAVPVAGRWCSLQPPWRPSPSVRSSWPRYGSRPPGRSCTAASSSCDPVCCSPFRWPRCSARSRPPSPAPHRPVSLGVCADPGSPLRGRQG